MKVRIKKSKKNKPNYCRRFHSPLHSPLAFFSLASLRSLARSPHLAALAVPGVPLLADPDDRALHDAGGGVVELLGLDFDQVDLELEGVAGVRHLDRHVVGVSQLDYGARDVPDALDDDLDGGALRDDPPVGVHVFASVAQAAVAVAVNAVAVTAAHAAAAV